MEMNVEYISIDKLIPYEFNNKIHNEVQVNRIANSIKEFGFLQPLVVDSNNVIIVGHGRLEGAKKLGLEEVPCIRADKLNKTQIKKYRILDNKLNESDWDDENLKMELEDLGDLYFGDNTESIEDLFGDIFGTDEREIIEDKVPTIDDKDAIVKRGDIFEMGGHRVMCGDSTDEGDVERLIAGATLNCIFSSPPYNMGSNMYEDYEDNLGSSEYIDFNMDVVKLLKPHLKGFLLGRVYKDSE